MQSYHYAHSQRAPRVPSRHHINATTIMRLHIKYLLGCLALLFLLPACKGESDVEEATLDLSAQSVTFTKDGGEQTLTVSTNKDSWSAFTTERSWLTVEQQGNTLKVKATANDRGMDRAASVVVNAGGIQRVVDVKQSAADVILDADATSLVFPAAGETKKLAISSNGGNVTAELASAVDWLTIDKVTPTAIVLTAKESTEKVKRSVKVNLTVGTVIKEIEVIQEGIMYYVLPYLKFPATLAEVIRYEKTRGNELIKLPDGLFNTTLYRFATQSKVMPFMQYEFSSETAAGFSSASTLCYDVTLVKDNADYDAFLKENGFETKEVGKDGKSVTYTNEKLSMQVQVAFQTGGAIITAKYAPKQDKDYATFKTLPMTHQTEMMSNPELKIIKDKKKDDIRKQEEAWGSKRDESITQDNYDRFITGTTAFEEEIYRGYFYIRPSKEDKIEENAPYIDYMHGAQAVYSNIELAFWKDAIGRYALTKEVLALFKDAGCPYLRPIGNKGYHAFYNKDKMQAYVMRVAFDKGKPIIEMQSFYEKIEGGGNSSVATLSNYARSIRAQQAYDKAIRRLERRILDTPLFR